MGAGTFLFFGLLLGHAYGNLIDYIVGDARGFLFLAGALPLLFFATRRKADLNFVVGCFLSIVAFFGAAKLFGYTLILAQIISVKQLYITLGEYIPQEINIWGHSSLIIVPRLFLTGDFWLMFALPLFVSLALVTKSRRMRVTLYGAIGMLFVGLVSSQTRGLWLGALLALAVVFWLSHLGNRLKIAIILPVLLLAVFSLSQDFLPSVRETIVTSFDFKESSNLGRVGQFQPLMDMVRKHVILGNGFGSYARDHPGPDPRAPWSYELQPMDFLMKMGVVGCGLWGLFLVWLLHGLWRVYKRAEDPTHRALAKGLLGGLWGMLFASATNPYFSSSPGMGCLTFTVVIVDMLYQQAPIRRRKEDGAPQQGERLQPNALASLRGAPSQVR
jgi:O-antigen ligase